MMKFFYTFLLTLLLGGCGGMQQYETGIEQQPKLIIRSEVMIGNTIEVGENFNLLVSKENLTPYPLGILGAKNSANEQLQTVVLEVASGTQSIRISNGSTVLYQKDLYFSDAQTREIRIRQ